MIETEIRNQIITEAMDAVLHFQKGQGQSTQEDDFDNDELEAAIGEIADQTLAEAQDQQAQDLQKAPQSPDMSNAIRDVVADEIGLWLKDHMPRIIAETMAQASVTASQTKPSIPSKPAKTVAKTTPKKAAKKASRSKAKPKVKAKAAKKMAKTPKSKAKKGKS